MSGTHAQPRMVTPHFGRGGPDHRPRVSGVRIEVVGGREPLLQRAGLGRHRGAGDEQKHNAGEGRPTVVAVSRKRDQHQKHPDASGNPPSAGQREGQSGEHGQGGISEKDTAYRLDAAGDDDRDSNT